MERFEPHKVLKWAFPHAACIGASMIGGWCTKGATEKGIIALSLSSEEVEETFIALQEGVKGDPALATKKIIQESKRTREKGVNLNLGGGAAADELAFTKTLVSAEEQCSDNGVAVMVMKMKIPFHCIHYVHCIPTDTSFIITKADPLKRIVWEIEGQNAVEYYAKAVGVSGVDNLTAAHFAKSPIGIVMGALCTQSKCGY